MTVVVLINGDYYVNFHRERKPAKCILMSFSVRDQSNINGDAFYTNDIYFDVAVFRMHRH